jgi:hypothetical protein
MFSLISKDDTTQFSNNIKVSRSDDDGEFIGHVLQPYFQDHGIICKITCFFTPQQNDIAKKINHYMLEITRACLIVAHIKYTFFRRCYLACYLYYETFT